VKERGKSLTSTLRANSHWEQRAAVKAAASLTRINAGDPTTSRTIRPLSFDFGPYSPPLRVSLECFDHALRDRLGASRTKHCVKAKSRKLVGDSHTKVRVKDASPINPSND